MYDLFSSIGINCINAGLCMYECAFLEVLNLAALNGMSPKLVMSQGSYPVDDNLKINYRLVYTGFSGELML